MKRRENVYKEIIINNILKNKRKYILLLLIFIIGIVLGVFFINNSDENQKKEINEYITNFVTTLKENNSIDKKELVKASLKGNIVMGIALWFIGSTVIGLPLIYFFVLYKGLCIGYTMSSAILTLSTGKGILFCIRWGFCAFLFTEGWEKGEDWRFPIPLKRSTDPWPGENKKLDGLEKGAALCRLCNFRM